MSNDRPTPSATIGELGLIRFRVGESISRLSWDEVLDLAVRAYWDRRGKKAA